MLGLPLFYSFVHGVHVGCVCARACVCICTRVEARYNSPLLFETGFLAGLEIVD